MLFKTASAICSTGNPAKNARQAVRAVRDAFVGFTAETIVYFSASDYDPAVLAAEMHDAFPGVVTFGFTTAGEAVDGEMLNGSVVAMAFGHGAFDYAETVLILGNREEVEQSRSRDVFHSARDAVRYLARNLGKDLRIVDYREYVGFMLADSVTDFNEEVLERFGDLSDVFLIGGVAGDDCKFDGSARVMYQGKVYGKDSCVLALWKPARGFSLLKTQAVEKTEHACIVTRADEKNKIVWELDGEDAAAVYARLIDVPKETLDILDFDKFPWAYVVNGEPYIQPVLEKIDCKGLRFNTRIHQGTRLTLTKAGDIFKTTQKALEAKRAEMESLSAILHINCAYRHTTLKNWGQLEEFGKLFGDVPSIAAASYGEFYVGLLAMTSSILLFK